MLDANGVTECPTPEEVQAALQARQYLRLADDPATLRELSEEANFGGIAELSHVIMHQDTIRKLTEGILSRAQAHNMLSPQATPSGQGSIRVILV